MTVFTAPAHYPAISLHQPYAGAIRLSGLGYPAKRIETRKTRIHYRGPLVICATAKSPSGQDAVAERLLATAPLHQAFDLAECFLLAACAVAIVQVVGCRRLVEEDFPRSLWWDAGEVARAPRWAWELEGIVPLRPFATHGTQGFFKVPRQRVDYAAVCGLADLWVQGGVNRTEAGLLGTFAWPLLDELDGSRA